MATKFNTIPSKILASSITSTATSFRLNNTLGWDDVALNAATLGDTVWVVFRNAAKTQIEIMEIDPTTIASTNITILKRGLKYDGDLTTEVTANKYPWTKSDTFVDLGTDTPQMFQWLKEYIEDIAIAGAPDASTTVKGLVEEATQAEIDADTATGATGAKLFTQPATLALSKYGTRLPSPDQKVFLNSTTGMISMYGASAAPTGFLLCDGSAVSRATYANLFAVISTNYGVGNGSTTFNLPDLQSRFPLGYSASAPTKILTFVSRASNVITITVLDAQKSNELQTGQTFRYSTTGTVITGLTNNTDYFIIRLSNTTFSLATDLANANFGTAITLTSDGTGTHTFTATYTARPIGQEGGTETQTTVASHYHSAYTSGGTQDSVEGGSLNTNTTSGTTGGSEPNNLPLYTVVNYIIKT